MKNLELKAVAKDLPRLQRALRQLGAKHEPRPLDQTDWYFTTPRGRLKLRRRRGEPVAELIFYLRPDTTKPRTSEYQTLPVADVPGMLRVLRAMFVPGVCVCKRRDLWLCGDTRVHLDRVARLGTFVEIEVPFNRRATEASRVMRMLTEHLGIGPGDARACSYADLMAGKAARRE
jgi:adenylate cyclase class IV